ncbi:MAG: hypothetical protein ABS980_18795, partial [Rhodococcus sp. (in: high G+C Gram-positive bacteria)]
MTVLTKSGSDAASGSESSGGRKVPIAIAMVAASLPMFMATLDNLVMTSALPVIEKELNASVGQLQWFMNAYTLCFATLMLSATTLGDRWLSVFRRIHQPVMISARRHADPVGPGNHVQHGQIFRQRFCQHYGGIHPE